MKCKLCNREGSYYRLRTNEWVCRNCGKISKGLTPPKSLIKKTRKIIQKEIGKI